MKRVLYAVWPVVAILLGVGVGGWIWIRWWPIPALCFTGMLGLAVVGLLGYGAYLFIKERWDLWRFK